MVVLGLLLLIQIVGIGLSMFASMVTISGHRKRMKMMERLKRRHWAFQQNSSMLIDYFQAFPESELRFEFPNLYKTALAVKKYKEIEEWKRIGILTEKEYQKELNKILPLIDIRQDMDMIGLQKK